MIDLSSARAKLDRAQVHFDALRAELEPYTSGGPVGFRSTQNIRGTDNPLLIRYFVDRIDSIPDSWSLMIGDLIHNARSALDNAAWSLISSQKSAAFLDVNGHNIHFPIYCERKKFTRSFLVQNLSTVSRDALASIQPYTRLKDHPERDGLWVLSQLSNIDKHRSIHVVTIIGHDSTVTTEPHLTDGEITFIEKGPMQVGSEVLTFTATRPAPNTWVNVGNTITAQVGIQTPFDVTVPLDIGITELLARAGEAVDAVESVI